MNAIIHLNFMGFGYTHIANDKNMCPKPASCIVGKTDPSECQCKQESLVNMGSGPSSYSDLFDPATSPNDPIFWIIKSFQSYNVRNWANA